MASRTRSTRGRIRPQKRVSYKEDDSSLDLSEEETEKTSEDSSFDSDSIVCARSQPPLSREALATHASSRAVRSGTKTRRKNSSCRDIRSMPRKKPIANVVSETSVENLDPVLRFGGKVPRWQNLPYHILLQIFHHVCLPLIFDYYLHSESVTWLLQTSRLCRSFMEPALSVFYYYTPISRDNVPRLIAHLASQTEGSALNYRAKVKYLDIDADCTTSNIAELVALTPQLRGLRVHYIGDQISWHRTVSRGRKFKGVYPQSIFQSLQTHHITLQEWIWNSLFMSNKPLVTRLTDIHSSYPFQSLQSLTFINFDGSTYGKEEIAKAINTLPQLKRLSFKSSLLVNQKLLLLLPNQLESIELINCPSISSEIMSLFLTSHGKNIRQLVLDHNRSLNLSFLVELAITCPRVEYLGINLRFYNQHVAYQDTRPKFKSLLYLNETPTWPASLQHLELFHLRKWSIEIADMFFTSLVDSAASLSNLRRLEIKASLEESGWRDRIMFRDKWVARLKEVFLRVSPPPKPHFYSIGAFYKHKHRLMYSDTAVPNTNVTSPGLAFHTRKDQKPSKRFCHIEINPDARNRYDNGSNNESKSTQAGNRRSKRIKLQADSHQQPPPRKSVASRRQTRRKKRSEDSSASEDSAIDDTVEKDSDDEKTSGRDDDERDFHIQGMCDVVNILIDNLRPTEDHFNENDFLDKEVSGDEDWNGDESHITEGRYAW